MIARILKVRGSTSSVLDYNEKKMMEGNAELVFSENIEDTSITGVYDTFDALESNPAIAEQVKNKSFHMTLGPGPNDRIDEKGCIECIREVMKELGYGEQPYLVYRHFDIEREHYHIVSSRINRKGRGIDPCNEAKRLMAFMKQLAPKYGFTVGAGASPMQEEQLPVLPTNEFSSTAGNSLFTLKALFEDALKYDFHSLYQFGCIMLAMNVRMKMWKRKDEGYNVALQGLDDKGRPVGRVVSLEKTLNVRGAEMYEKRLAENNAMGVVQLDRKVVIREIADYCAERTGSAEEFCAALEEAGIRHVLQRDPDKGTIKRLTLVEKKSYALVDSAVRGELFIQPLVDAEKEGRWRKPDGRKKAVPGAKVRRKDSPVFFTPERTKEVQERITLALQKYRKTTPQLTPGKSAGRSLSQGKR